jgi:uncharacterized protein YjdB
MIAGILEPLTSESANAALLLSITVAPTAASIAAGNTQQFTATGHYSDLSTQNLTSSVTWSSSLTSFATVSNTSGSKGLATGVATGASTITATSGLISGAAVLTVTPAILVAITVAPTAASIAAGDTQQFTATGHYSDLSTQDLTSSVTWSSSLTSFATVSSSGLATGVATGASTITATSGLISGAAVLTVTPAVLLAITVSPAVASIAAGDTQQFTATGHYSDLSTQDLTSNISWSSSLTTFATVSNASGSKGLATGVSTGATTITGTSGLISGTAVLTVTPAVLLAITVSPAVASIAAGDTQQFTAIGHYSDLSTQDLTSSVTWSSSLTSFATVSNASGSKGLATAVATGATTITATSGLGSGSAVLTVAPAVLSSITISPTAASIGVGDTQQFTATGHYSDQSTQDLTPSVAWSSSLTSVATVSNASGSQGLATGAGPGDTQIKATDVGSGLQAVADLTVTMLSITPSSGPPSTPVQIRGADFPAGLAVKVKYVVGSRWHRLCAVTTASDGTFACNATIPKVSRAGAIGQHTILAKGRARHHHAVAATTTFSLIAGAAPAPASHSYSPSLGSQARVMSAPPQGIQRKRIRRVASPRQLWIHRRAKA